MKHKEYMGLENFPKFREISLLKWNFQWP